MKRTNNQKNDLIDGGKFFSQFVANLFKYGEAYNVSNETLYGELKLESFAEKIIKSIVSSVKNPVKKLFSGNDYLKLISGEGEIIIDSCDGTEPLSEATDTFVSIDHDFENLEKGGPTEAIKVGVYGLIKDSQFTGFFNSVGVGLDKLCFTQHQIKKFVQKHRNWLRTNGYATFFLFKSKGKFFVAYVFIRDDGTLRVGVFRLVCDALWVAEYRPRVVIPQLDITL